MSVWERRHASVASVIWPPRFPTLFLSFSYVPSLSEFSTEIHTEASEEEHKKPQKKQIFSPHTDFLAAFMLALCYMIRRKGQQEINLHLTVLLCHSAGHASRVSIPPALGNNLLGRASSCSSGPRKLSQGCWEEGMWPRSGPLDSLPWEAAPIDNSMENRWKPLRLSFLRSLSREHTVTESLTVPWSCSSSCPSRGLVIQ